MKKQAFRFLFLFFLMVIVGVYSCNQLLKVPEFEPDITQTDTSDNAHQTDTISQEIVEVEESIADLYAWRYANLPDSFMVHLAGGIPFDSDTTDDYLIFRSQYVLSYNAQRGVPNWVSWHLDSSWIGNSGRYRGNFITDHSLPSAFYRVKHADYTNTGFDRGHVVRSHERTRTEQDNRSTFFMTNIIPQTPDLNRGVWLSFERFCESLALDSGLQLLVISGGIYPNNRSLNNLGKVSIPDSCFKIVLASKKPLSPENIDSSTRVYSVMMPNTDGIRNAAWRVYSTSVSRIERSSGYTFWARLPEDLQAHLKNK